MDVVFDSRMTETAAVAPVMVAVADQLVIAWPGITEDALLQHVADVAPALDLDAVRDAYARARLDEQAAGEAAVELADAPTIEIPALAMAGPAPWSLPPVSPAGPTSWPGAAATAPQPRTAMDDRDAPAPAAPPAPAAVKPMRRESRHVGRIRPWFVVLLAALFLLAIRPVSNVTGIAIPGTGPARDRPAPQPSSSAPPSGGRRTSAGGTAAGPGARPGSGPAASASLSPSPTAGATNVPSQSPGASAAASAPAGATPSGSAPPAGEPSASPTSAPASTPAPTPTVPSESSNVPPDSQAPTPQPPPDSPAPGAPVDVSACVPGVVDVNCP